MRIILLFAAVIVFGCSSQKHFKPGVYHFLDDQEMNTQISQTIRFEKDKTFAMYGIMKDIAKDSSTHPEYYNYVAFGDWKLNGQTVTLNTNPLYQGKPQGMLKASDMKNLRLRPWNYLEVVLKIQNDSFLIDDKSRSLVSIKNGIRLNRQ